MAEKICETIRKVLVEYQSQIINAKLALYPYGTNGRIVKDILEFEFNIKPHLLVDNSQYMDYSFVVPLTRVENPNDYIWIVNSSDPDTNQDIIKSLREIVRLENVVNLFSPDHHKKLQDDSGFFLISKKDEFSSVSIPSMDFINIVQKRKNEINDRIVIAEIGVGIGATTVEVCKLLQEQDVYYLFDYHTTIQMLLHDLDILKNNGTINCKIMGKGNSERIYDSYCWPLSVILLQNINENRIEPFFDVVYLDGAHTFLHDGLACCLIKLLLKPNGYIIFDDMKWSYATSETSNTPSCRAMFTEEQFNGFQVKRVVDVFMKCDADFELISDESAGRAIYRKNAIVAKRK